MQNRRKQHTRTTTCNNLRGTVSGRYKKNSFLVRNETNNCVKFMLPVYERVTCIFSYLRIETNNCLKLMLPVYKRGTLIL